MPDSQNHQQEKIESAKDEQVKNPTDRPAGSYYYDDATGYDLYQDEDEPDDTGELKNEGCNSTSVPVSRSGGELHKARSLPRSRDSDFELLD